MKKIISLLLVVVIMMFSVVACASKPDVDSKKSESVKTETTDSNTDTEVTDSNANTSDSDSDEVIKIGLMISLTGGGVQTGEECQALAEIFEDVINNKHEGISLPFAEEEGLPNLGGAKIKFVIGDQSTPDIALTETERLITEEGVIGLCGNFSSATTKTAMVAAEKYGVPVISEGTSMSLTDAGYKYFGRSFPGDDLFIDDCFSFIDYVNETQDAGIKTIALVSEDSEFGANIANVEAATAEKYGYEVIETISYNKEATNVTSEVLRLKEVDADAVLMSSYPADSLLFMSTYKEQNYFPKFLFGQRGGFMATDFATNLGSDSDFVLTGSRWNADMQSDAAQDIGTLFKDKTGLTLIGDTLTSVWDGVLLAYIANQAGSTDGDEMRSVMAEGLDLDSSLDPFGLEGYVYPELYGQNEFGRSIIVQYMDGILNTVYPAENANMEVVYPALGWDER